MFRSLVRPAAAGRPGWIALGLVVGALVGGSVHAAQAAAPAQAEPAKNPFRAVKESLNSILRHDDGNVSMEQQIAELSKNQMQHNMAVNLLASQFRLLQAAISERV